MATTKQDKAAAIARLKEWLKDGDTLWFILRHRSASGMQRVYSVKQLEVEMTGVFASGPKATGKVNASDLSSNIGMACGYAWHKDWYGIKVNGCGFSGEQDIADAVAHVCGFEHLWYETL